MFHSATTRIWIATVLTVSGVYAQSVSPAATDWRHIGNAAIDRSLAGLATGPVDRAWYSAGGSLLIHTVSGHVFETADFETWKASAVVVPPVPVNRTVSAARLPEPAAIREGQQAAYAFGKFVYRSENEGASWSNLTEFRSASIIGDPLYDLAVSPSNDDEVTAVGANGVFRSMDGGKTWSGLNQALPNLPAARLLRLPSGERGTSLELSDGDAVEWAPGQKTAWTPVDDARLISEMGMRRAYSMQRGTLVTAIANSGDYIYTGMAQGRMSVSSDGGANWTTSGLNGTGAIERIWVDPNDPRIALAVAGARARELTASSPSPHLLRTQNGGLFWDDLTGNLPDVAAHGVTADPASGAVYIATDAGVFMTYTDLQALGPAPKWTLLEGLPQARAMDAHLDAQGNQLWVALDGLGVYATLAPHRLRDPRVVSTADLVARAAAPGSLVSVLGTKVQTAQAGSLAIPVLTATDSESQLQIPFEATGSSLSLSVNGGVTLPAVALGPAAPAIFVDRDGSPILLDEDSGMMLNAMNPAHSRTHLQILATGLGRVNPEWPTGIPGPVDNPPQVVATVHAYLDRQPVEVTRAVLAPYIGFYIIDVNVPKIVNYGPAELYLEVDGQLSNRVRVYIQP